MTGSVADALRLGCSAIGFTIYPGSEYAFDQMEELRELAEEAKDAGLAVVVWSYPRGPGLDKAGETAIDICAYAAHMAALLGAHIIKVKPPTAHLSLPAAKQVYEAQHIDISTQQARIAHVVQCCFNGRRWWCSRAARRRTTWRRSTTEIRAHARRRRLRQHHRAQHVPAPEARRRWRCSPSIIDIYKGETGRGEREG